MYRLEYPIFDINDVPTDFEQIVPLLPDTCWLAAMTVDGLSADGVSDDWELSWIVGTEDPNLDISTLPYPFGVGDVNKWTKV